MTIINLSFRSTQCTNFVLFNTDLEFKVAIHRLGQLEMKKVHKHQVGKKQTDYLMRLDQGLVNYYQKEREE